MKLKDIFKEISFPEQKKKPLTEVNFVYKGVIELWISKKKRAGKVVTIMKFRDKSENIKAEMTKILKGIRYQFSCGTSFKNNEGIIQYGDRDKLKEYLIKEYSVILCGS